MVFICCQPFCAKSLAGFYIPSDGSRISMNRLFVQTFLTCGRGLWQVRTPTAFVPSFGARIGTFNPIRTLKIRARKWQTQLISTLNLTRMKERWARIGARLIRYWGRLNGRPTGRAFLGCPSRAVHLTRSISTYPSSQFMRSKNFIFLSLLHLQAAEWIE